jgi:hypothetical protein
VTQEDKIVEEAVPHSEIVPTVADLPPDYGQPGLADFADPAWDDITDEDDNEVPGEGEPEEDENDIEEDKEAAVLEGGDEEDEMEENPVVPPGVVEENEDMPEPDEEFDHDPEDVEED